MTVSLSYRHRIKLEEIDTLYGKFDKRVPGLLKTFVETRFSAPPKAGYPTLTSVHDLPEA